MGDVAPLGTKQNFGACNKVYLKNIYTVVILLCI